MLPSEINLAQTIASSITSTTTYVILCLLTAFIIYFFHLLDFFELPNSYKMIIALVLPIALWEFILSFVFGLIGIPLSWGSYAYHFPYFGNFVITSGVQLSKFLEFVFDFGIFKEFGLPYFTEFVKNVPIGSMVSISVPENASVFTIIGVVFSGWLPLLTWFYVSVDSLIDLVFFYVLFSAILAVLAENIKNQKIYAFGLAWIPVILYSYYISNPFQEFPKALVTIQKVFYFWGHGSTGALLVFFGTLVFSFFIVMEIIALIMHLLLKGGTVMLRPDWAAHEWTVSTQGQSFGFSVAFLAMYFMHGFSYYLFFPFMILYSLLKKVSGTAIHTMQEHREKQEIRDLVGSINNDNTPPIKSISGNKNYFEYILYAGIIIIVLALLYNNGIFK